MATPGFRVYAGQALPGFGDRSETLDHGLLEEALGMRLAQGTFNVGLLQDPDLGEPSHVLDKYKLYPCEVSVEKIINEGKRGFPAWIVDFTEENDTPARFVEIISQFHLRKALNKGNWPAFACEIGLQLPEREED